MQRKRLAIFYLCLQSALAVACSHDSGVTKEKVDALIAKEVPSGASKEQVVIFLDAHHIEHSDIEILSPEVLKEPELDTYLSSAELKEKLGRVKKRIVAKIRNVQSDLTTRWDIFIMFYFDENERLVGHIVRTIGTGL
jgi:hypothetical protein